MAETTYRQPTSSEKAKLDKSRNMMVRGIEGEKDMLSRFSTTAAKSARDDQKAATSLRNSVSEKAREGEAYNDAGYKKGGMTKMAKGGSASSRADGCAQRGKTRA
jgi:hypothetical protein